MRAIRSAGFLSLPLILTGGKCVLEVAGSVVWGGDGVIPNQNALDCKFAEIWMSSVAMGVAIID